MMSFIFATNPHLIKFRAPSENNFSFLFSGEQKEYYLTHLIFPTPSLSSYPLADNTEYPNINSTMLKTHLCLPQLKF